MKKLTGLNISAAVLSLSMMMTTGMVSAHEDSKENLFDRIDNNGDGVISAKEQRVAKRLYNKLDANNDGVIGAREKLRAKAIYKHADINKDGKIGKKERRLARKSFNSADVNNDGRIGPREWRRVKVAHKAIHKHAQNKHVTR